MQQLEQFLHETAQVYEASQIMGFIEHDDAFDRSLVWMRQRVASTLSGPAQGSGTSNASSSSQGRYA